jgi:hypothetical protein
MSQFLVQILPGIWWEDSIVMLSFYDGYNSSLPSYGNVMEKNRTCLCCQALRYNTASLIFNYNFSAKK